MNLTGIARNVERLSTADAIIVESYLQYVLRKSALCILGGVIALAAALLFELSTFWMLEPSIGAVPAALILGTINFTVAGLVFVVAALRPTGAWSLALQMRQTAIQALGTDLSRGAIETQDSSRAMRPAIELVSALLVPVVAHVMRRMSSRAKRDGQGDG